MDSICLYTIVNPSNGIKDYTCLPDYAQQKSSESYRVFANMISKKPITYFYPDGVIRWK